MNIRNRNVEIRRVRAGDLAPNPLNWRTHPQAQQDALRGLLAEVGFVGTLLAYQPPGKPLTLIDGHLRSETTPDTEVDVCIVDLTEEEARKVLVCYDPLTSMAEADQETLDALMRDLETSAPALQAMLDELAESHGNIEPAKGEWPEVNETTEHSFLVRYADDDLPDLIAFLGVDELPVNGIGAMVIERIKAVAQG